MKSHITDYHIPTRFTFEEYRALSAMLVDQGKTTGPNQSEALAQFTKLNHSRIRRIYKTTKIAEYWTDLKLPAPLALTTITETWCGDAAQSNPVIERIAEHLDIASHYVLRDSNLHLMEDFLTDGGRSIPIVIIHEAISGKILGTWGPRPEHIQQMVMDRKASENPEPYETFSQKIQQAYNEDKRASVQQGFYEALQKAISAY